MWPKIQDVAREAGVSPATVSRVLNKTKHVGPELTRRVLDAVEKLQYRPNPYARWLSSKRSNVVGLIMPSVDDGNRAAYLHECSATLRANDLEVMVGLTTGSTELERELVAAYIQSHVAGIIFTSHGVDRATRASLSAAGIPVLFAWNEDGTGRSPTVQFDTSGAAEALVNRLQLPRYRKAWLLTGPREEGEANARAISLVNALSTKGRIDVEEIECDGSAGDAFCRALGKLTGSAPDLLLCTSDYLAIGALRAAHDSAIAVPSQLSIAGFGRSIYSRAWRPSLTTVELDARELGRVTGETMVELVSGREVTQLRQVGFRVIGGESCPLSETTWQP
jgi:DNA-binding LacI/PurR family transcriptional regulator